MARHFHRPPAVTRRTRHGCQRSRPATGVSRGLNTADNASLSLSTLAPSGCLGLASPASHHPVEAFLACIGIRRLRMPRFHFRRDEVQVRDVHHSGEFNATIDRLAKSPQRPGQYHRQEDAGQRDYDEDHGPSRPQRLRCPSC